MNSKGSKVGFSFCAALSMALLLCLTTSANAVTSTTEQFGTASDGTPLHWDVYAPATPGPWPVVLVIHGGGFRSGGPEDTEPLENCAQDLAAAGYLALAIEYRLAPPGALQGQTSDGFFLDQTADVQLAVRAARSDPRCDGKVGAVGGSAGGHHVALAACIGTQGDDRIDVGVALSGAYDLSDFSANPGIGAFTNIVNNFVGKVAPTTAALRAASPAWLLDKTASPLFLVNTLEDSMPYSQLPDMVSHLDAAGVTNYDALSLPGDGHAFAFWSVVRERALAFLAAGFAGKPAAPSPSPLPSPPEARQLLNVSTRAQVVSGDSVMIGGFIVTGTNAKRVVLRGLGPSLSQAGVSATLSDPVLQLFDSAGVLVETDDNWNLAGGVLGELSPKNSKESLLSAILPAGSYTAILSGAAGAEGVGLFELYDVDSTNGRISNLSTRGQVGTAADVIIGGFIIGGTESIRVIARALGPSLSSLGVSNALQDPILQLYDNNGDLLASNDNWRSTQQQAIIDTSIPPSDDRESAIVASLAPGNYTAIVSGVAASTGVGLIEVYTLNDN